MRERTLKVFDGGGEGPRCYPCEMGWFLDEGRDEEVRGLLKTWAEEQRESGRITACGAHHEDIRALGISLGPLVKEARHRRRATKAVQQRAHRQMVRAAAAHTEALIRQQAAAKKKPDGDPFTF